MSAISKRSATTSRYNADVHLVMLVRELEYTLHGIIPIEHGAIEFARSNLGRVKAGRLGGSRYGRGVQRFSS